MYTVLCISIPEYIPTQLEVQNSAKEVLLLLGDEQAHLFICKVDCILILCPTGFQMPIYTFGSSEGETVYSVIYIINGGGGPPLYMQIRCPELLRHYRLWVLCKDGAEQVMI